MMMRQFGAKEEAIRVKAAKSSSVVTIGYDGNWDGLRGQPSSFHNDNDNMQDTWERINGVF
ncbi:hypothetical protein L484_000225 [Morus notabilis]|uniref:Uncharacterized protein n=1 Tax=Morus notabilis TaxID=981085 RepID=W9SMG9_9ROSA|nr:hypothetical protein L484_000225 [Morus notabilis]